MTDILFFCVINLLYFILGFPVTRIIPKKLFTYRLFLSGVFGYGMSAVTGTVLYKYGFSTFSLFNVFLLLSIINIIFLTKYAYKYKDKWKINILINKKYYILILFWLIGSIILISPRLTGGNQFSVFQGNIWDNFGYLNSAVIYSTENYNTILNSSNNSFISNPLLSYGFSNLFIRPSVHLLYSIFSNIIRPSIYKLHYTFLISFFSQLILVYMFILLNIIKKEKYILIGIISIAFSLGFFGQYILDINAWSQISSVPVILVIMGIIIILFGNDKIIYDKKIYWEILIIFLILFSATLYLYPESLVFHIPIIFILSIIYIIKQIKKNKKISIIVPIYSGGILSLLIGLFFYRGTIGFVINQIIFSSRENVNWWEYFQKYLLGRDLINNDILLNNISDFISCFSGLYFWRFRLFGEKPVNMV